MQQLLERIHKLKPAHEPTTLHVPDKPRALAGSNVFVPSGGIDVSGPIIEAIDGMVSILEFQQWEIAQLTPYIGTRTLVNGSCTFIANMGNIFVCMGPDTEIRVTAQNMTSWEPVRGTYDYMADRVTIECANTASVDTVQYMLSVCTTRSPW